jgi:hypothetical protein
MIYPCENGGSVREFKNFKWINQRLGMGEVSRVTQAASSKNKNEDISLVRIKRRLERIL